MDIPAQHKEQVTSHECQAPELWKEPGRREPLREQQGLGRAGQRGAGAQGDPARSREGPEAAAGEGEGPLEPLGGH